MNQLHENDKKNQSKHRKMISRGAMHPRAGMKTSATRFVPTGKVVNFGTPTEPEYKAEIISRGVVTRNNQWVAG